MNRRGGERVEEGVQKRRSTYFDVMTELDLRKSSEESAIIQRERSGAQPTLLRDYEISSVDFDSFWFDE